MDHPQVTSLAGQPQGRAATLLKFVSIETSQGSDGSPFSRLIPKGPEQGGHDGQVALGAGDVQRGRAPKS